MKKVIICIMLIALLGACQGQIKKTEIVQEKTEVILTPEILAVIRWLAKIRTGENWGQREYLADIEYYREMKKRN